MDKRPKRFTSKQGKSESLGISPSSNIRESVTPELAVDGRMLVTRLSFTHLLEFICTKKDYALVEYALAGMDNRLFVSKYQLELPKKEDMQRFIEQQMQEAEE